jgi:hypothetical protein
MQTHSPSEKLIFKRHKRHKRHRPTFDHLIKTLNSFAQVSDIASLSPALSCQFDNIRQRSNILSQAVSGLLRCRTLANVRHHTETSQTTAARWRSAAGVVLAVIDPISDQLTDATARYVLSLSRIQCKASRRKDAQHKPLGPRMPQAIRSDPIKANTADAGHGRRTGRRHPLFRSLLGVPFSMDGLKLV